MRFAIILCILLFCSSGFIWLEQNTTAPPSASYADAASGWHMKLSDYQLFEGTLAELQPAADVLPYELNTPLFSDYAHKARFIRLPKGSTVAYNDKLVFDFPKGTVIAKTFYYPVDARKPEKGKLLLETRILIHAEEGWKALPYVWDENQTDAYLDVAGASREVSWRDGNGKKQKLSYTVPNMNQCKGCHSYKNELKPIGPSARQLNGKLAYKDGTQNQLEKWADQEWLTGLPDLSMVPQLPVWSEAASGTLSERARAYLDINCGHCHNEYGPANTSGLFLDIHEDNPAAWGVNKSPIAAGRGSGGRKYGIAPGKPDESILLYRMDSDDPGVMMPELSRKLIHKEGVSLIRKWIEAM